LKIPVELTSNRSAPPPSGAACSMETSTSTEDCA
jgi:hypothetical protein